MHDDGSYIAIPIRYEDAVEVRHWCAEHCLGDFLISLGRSVIFQFANAAALAALQWRRDDE